MPEGDTILEVAAALRPDLEGRRLRAVELWGRPVAAYSSRRVIGVESRGKNLLLHLDGDETIRVHLGMHGSWHRYTEGERWQRAPRRASLVLRTEAFHVLVLGLPAGRRLCSVNASAIADLIP